MTVISMIEAKAVIVSEPFNVAIPVLEERLEIPNQTDVVRAELDQARAGDVHRPLDRALRQVESQAGDLEQRHAADVLRPRRRSDRSRSSPPTT